LDFMVIKYNNTGTQQWVQYFDGGQNIGDYLTCATFDKAGNIVVGGNSNFQGATQYDISVVKYSTSGTQLWSYTYNNSASNFDDNAYDITSDINNNIFVIGNTYVTNARNMLTIKLNSSGVNQWTKIVTHTASGSDEYGYGITTDVFGNSYATGALSDWTTIKYDTNGNIIWTNHRPASALNNVSPKKVMLDRANNVIIASDAFYSGGNGTDIEVNKLNNANGTAIWSNHFQFSGTDSYVDAKLDTNNNIYVSGFFDGPLSKDIGSLIMNPNGNVIWNATYTNTNNINGVDRAAQMTLDNNFNIIIAGTAERRGSGSADAVDVFTLKYNAITVGIKSNSLEEVQLTIFPNPCKDVLNLSTANQNLIGATIVVSDLLGKTIINQQLNNLYQTINFNTINKGIYILTISNQNGSITKKLIVD